MTSLRAQLDRLATAGIRTRTDDDVAALVRAHVPPDDDARPWALLLETLVRLDLTDAAFVVGRAPWSRPSEEGVGSDEVARRLRPLLGEDAAAAVLGASPLETDVGRLLARLAPALAAQCGLSALMGRPVDDGERMRWERGNAWLVAFARPEALREATAGHFAWEVAGAPTAPAEAVGTTHRWVCFPPCGHGFFAFSLLVWPSLFAVFLSWHLVTAGVSGLGSVHPALLAVTVLGLYPLAVMFLNWRGVATRTDGEIRVRRGMIPWPGNLRLRVPCADVVRVCVVRRLDTSGESASAEYAHTVWLALRDGRTLRAGDETFDAEKAETLRAVLAGEG